MAATLVVATEEPPIEDECDESSSDEREKGRKHEKGDEDAADHDRGRGNDDRGEKHDDGEAGKKDKGHERK